MTRWRARWRAMISRYTDPLVSSVEPVLGGIIVLFLLAVVWLGVASRKALNQPEALIPLLQGQATSALSIALLALAAWAAFQLRYRRARLRYLQPYRRPLPAPEDSQDDSPVILFRTVVDQLLAIRPRRSLLVVADQDSDFPDLSTRLPAQIARHHLVPVVVDVSDCGTGASLPALGREGFVSRLAGSTGDEPRAQRLFRREADKGKVIVVVVGLDHVAEAKPRAARRAAIEALLRTSLSERIPFIAAVSDDLAPRISEVAVVRVRAPQRIEGLRAHLLRLLKQRGIYVDEAVGKAVHAALAADDPTVDQWYLGMAADIILARVRNGQEPAAAITELFAPRSAFRRHLSWMCERALDCGMDEASAQASSPAQALAAIGVQAHFRQELTTSWRDATFDFDAQQRLRFAAGVSVLSRRNVLTLTADPADPALRFNRPEWLSFAGALGLRLDGSRWGELLTPGVPQATVDSLTAALILDGASADPRNRSFLAVLSRLKQGRLQDISLEMILAVVTALQVDQQPLELGRPEIAALRRAWQASTDATRLLFVSTVEPHPALARFLWEQVVPPQFHANSYRVRRAICGRLAAMGTIVWDGLAGQWGDLVVAGRKLDLSAQSRLTGTYWEDCGLPLASACWVLPSLTERVADSDREAAVRMLGDVRGVVTRSAQAGRRGPGYVPDIGLEISLAEGFKMASVESLARSGVTSPAWRDEALVLYREAESWTSRQVLVQAFALAEFHGSVQASDGAATESRPTPRHPFVREAAALVQRMLASRGPGAGKPGPAGDGGGWEHQQVERHIWFDDVEALEDGGYGLSAPAHRLLGLSTLLINLAEGALERAAMAYRAGPGGEPSEPVLRELALGQLAFTSDKLPKCFVSAGHTATMLDVECDCPFRLCGPVVAGGVGRRQISKAFAQRAEVTCAAPLALGREHAFVRHQFADIWNRPEIAADEAT